MEVSGLNVWEAVDTFNERSATGRVVVNPPSKRGQVAAYRTPNSWYLCKCGRAFTNVEKYVEHKSSHEARHDTPRERKKKSFKVKTTSVSLFKNYNGFQVKTGTENEMIRRFGKISKAKIEASVVKKLDDVLRAIDEDIKKSYSAILVETKNIKLEAKTLQVSSLGVEQEDYLGASKSKQERTNGKEAKESTGAQHQDGKISNFGSDSMKGCLLRTNREYSIRCYKCNKTFTKPQQLQLHSKYKHPKFARSNRRNLTEPLKDNQNKDSVPASPVVVTDKSFRCKICHTKYYSRIGLFRHLMVKHDGAGVFSCKFCEFKTSKVENLELHMKKFHKSTKKTCKMSTRSKNSELSPSLSLAGINGLSNDDITASLPQNNAVEGENSDNVPHNGVSHNENQSNVLNFKATRSGFCGLTIPRYRCLQCCKIFISEGTLRRHNNIFHNESQAAVVSVCTICNKKCHGTCKKSKKITLELSLRKKLRQKIISRMVSLRSAARKMTDTDEVHCNNLSSAKIDEEFSESVNHVDEEKQGQLASTESIVARTRLSRSATIESQLFDENSESFFQNRESRDKFYDTIGARTRSKNESFEIKDEECSRTERTLKLEAPSNDTKFSCPICKQLKKSRRSLSKHIYWNHPNNGTSGMAVNKSYKSETVSKPSKPKINGGHVAEDGENVEKGMTGSSIETIPVKLKRKYVKCATCNVIVHGDFFQKHQRSRTHLNNTFDADKCGKKCPPTSLVSACTTNDTQVDSDASSIANSTSEVSETATKCEICGQKFKSPKFLKRHRKSHNFKPMQTKFECETCGKTFSHKHVLKLHEDRHHSSSNSEAKFKCDMCPYGSQWLSVLDRHKKVCHVPNGIRCDGCPRTFVSPRALLIHSSRRHKRSLTGSAWTCGANVNGDSSVTSSSHELDACSSSSDPSSSTRQQSVSPPQERRSISADNAKTNIYLVNCKKCGRSISKGQYDRHLRIAHVRSGKFPCDRCNCVFATKQSAAAHRRKPHSVNVDTAPHNSSTLFEKNRKNSKLFGQESEETGEEIVASSDPKWSRCSLCQLLIPGGSTQMVAHRKIAHVKNSEFGCNYCSCSFSDDHGLKVHLSTVIHTSTDAEKSEHVLSSPKKSPEKKTTPTKQENKIQGTTFSGPNSKNHFSPTLPSYRNNEDVSVRRDVFPRTLIPTPTTNKVTVETSTSTSITPAQMHNFHQLIPGEIRITGKNQYIIKPAIINRISEPEDNDNVPVIVSCYSQNPEYLKKHSPQKLEWSAPKTSLPTVSSNVSQQQRQSMILDRRDYQNKDISEGIRKSTGMSASNLVWSPPKNTTNNSQNVVVITTTNSSSVAIKNILGNADTHITALRNKPKVNGRLGERRIPRILESASSARVIPSIIGSNAASSVSPLNNDFKVPLPPRPKSLTKVASSVSPTFNSFTASIGRVGTIKIPPSTYNLQPSQTTVERNNFVFPSLNLSSTTTLEKHKAVNEVSVGSPSSSNAHQNLSSGTDTHVVGVQQSSEHHDAYFSQPHSVSAPKSQNGQQTCPLFANTSSSLSSTTIQVQSHQLLFRDTQQIQIQSQTSLSSIGDEKNTNGNIRPRLVTCNVCMKSFFSQTKLSNHMKIHEADGSKETSPLKAKSGGKCGYCGDVFGAHSALWAHLKVCRGPGSPASSVNISSNGFL